MDQMIKETLNSNVVAILKKELVYKCTVWPSVDQVVLEISDTDFEKHMGCLIQQIQNVIDKVPSRKKRKFIHCY